MDNIKILTEKYSLIVSGIFLVFLSGFFTAAMAETDQKDITWYKWHVRYYDNFEFQDPKNPNIIRNMISQQKKEIKTLQDYKRPYDFSIITFPGFRLEYRLKVENDPNMILYDNKKADNSPTDFLWNEEIRAGNQAALIFTDDYMKPFFYFCFYDRYIFRIWGKPRNDKDRERYLDYEKNSFLEHHKNRITKFSDEGDEYGRINAEIIDGTPFPSDWKFPPDMGKEKRIIDLTFDGKKTGLLEKCLPAGEAKRNDEGIIKESNCFGGGNQFILFFDQETWDAFLNANRIELAYEVVGTGKKGSIIIGKEEFQNGINTFFLNRANKMLSLAKNNSRVPDYVCDKNKPSLASLENIKLDPSKSLIQRYRLLAEKLSPFYLYESCSRRYLNRLNDYYNGILYPVMQDFKNMENYESSDDWKKLSENKKNLEKLHQQSTKELQAFFSEGKDRIDPLVKKLEQYGKQLNQAQ